MEQSKDFSKDELARYSRHIILPEFGEEGQAKLKNAKVLIIGAGGLGSPLLLYLTAAGVGTIGIVDFDNIELSNLQRQLLFTEDDVGKSKAQAAYNRLKSLNSNIEFKLYEEKLTADNALEILKDYDVIADGTDNFPTRYLVNDACVMLDKPNVYGSIYRFEGQVSVFNYVNNEGDRGPNYRDLFPEPPPPEMVPNCAEGGVLGVLTGIIGSMQASEVIKVITGIGSTLSGRLFIIDTLSFETRTVKLRKAAEENIISELINYEEFCGMNNNESPYDVKEISVHELKDMINNGDDYQLIDVRTAFENHVANIGGDLIPLEEIVDHLEKISKTKQVVMYCKVGIRSMEAILHLQSVYEYTNLYNLKGGINAWATEIDNKFI
ncbi:MAG: molybdenum cofactor biosynthesis protein MoeB [Bacteroidetes bacterium]|nr:MAG: molybdenum cofactor biosynthesis protein MoeB [Bacteroidota bacterium]